MLFLRDRALGVLSIPMTVVDLTNIFFLLSVFYYLPSFGPETIRFSSQFCVGNEYIFYRAMLNSRESVLFLGSFSLQSENSIITTSNSRNRHCPNYIDCYSFDIGETLNKWQFSAIPWIPKWVSLWLMK